MLFWNKICGFAAIFIISAFSSSGQILETQNLSLIKSKDVFVNPLSSLSYKIKNNGVDFLSAPSLSLIPQNYYTQHFGIMCKQELALEKSTKIPFRFRLGSLQQCNYLEGKK